MAHGAPDWSNVRKGVVLYRLDDLAELAARLGSIDTFDRRGDVLFMEDFEDGDARWQGAAVGTSALRNLSLVTHRSGYLSALVQPGTATGDLTQLETFLARPTLSPGGLEVAFAFQVEDISLDAYLVYYDGTYAHWSAVRFRPDLNLFYYRDSAGNWQSLSPSVDHPAAEKAWGNLKMVVNWETERYVRAILDNQVYSLSGLTYQKTSTTAKGQIMVRFEVINRGTGVKPTYLDDVIVTQNEP